MGDAKLSAVQNIEELQQKVQTYKETLSALKTRNSTEEYLLIKTELDRFQEKFTDLEKIIKKIDEKQNIKIKEYEQEITNLSTQLVSLNRTVEELNQQNLTHRASEKQPRNAGFEKKVNEEKSQPAKKLSGSAIPSFKQLHKMSQQSQLIEELSSDYMRPEAPPHTNHRRSHQEFAPEKNYGLNKRFPNRQSSIQRQTIHPKPRVNMNEPSPAKRISVKLSTINAYPLPHTTVENEATLGPTTEELSQDAAFNDQVQKQNTVEELVQPNNEQLAQKSNTNQNDTLQTITDLKKANEEVQPSTEIKQLNDDVSKHTETTKKEIVLTNENIRLSNESFIENNKTKQTNEEVVEMKNASSNKIVSTEKYKFDGQTLDDSIEQSAKNKEPLSLLNIFRKK